MEPPSRRSRGALALQTFGFLLSLGALTWAISLAMSEGNRENLARLRHADTGTLALLGAATIASVIVNGLMFWATILPARRLKAIDVVATNSIAVFLSILPFKLGLVTRVLIHHRRDAIPFKLIVAWMGAMAALGLAVFVPLGAAGLWAKSIDARWALAAGLGILLTHAIGYACARAAKRQRWLSRLSLGADELLSDPRVLCGVGLMRLLDAGLLSARFLIASRIAGHDLNMAQATLMGTTFFLITVLSLGGALGFREGGIAALALAMGMDEKALALIALMVSGSEVVISGLMAAGSCFIIRPDKLLARRG